MFWLPTHEIGRLRWLRHTPPPSPRAEKLLSLDLNLKPPLGGFSTRDSESESKGRWPITRVLRFLPSDVLSETELPKHIIQPIS